MGIPLPESGTLMHRPLRRSRHRRVVAGVCAGVAQWLGWDPGVLRVLLVIAAIFTPSVWVILVYAVLWIGIPEEHPRGLNRLRDIWDELEGY